MRRYTRLMTVCLVLTLMAIAIANLLVLNSGNADTNALYKVEINRIMNGMVSEGAYREWNLAGFPHIEKIEFLPAEAPDREIRDFYAPDSGNVLIQPLYVEDICQGYIKFHYTYAETALLHKTLLIMNSVFTLLFVVVTVVFVQLRNRLLKPFEVLAEMPRQLARGQLLKPARIEKSQYLERFLWGLDVLRESLTIQKKRHQNTEREKKTLILSLSHDIKTPLSAIKLYAKALKENLYDDPEKQHDIVNRIEEKSLEIEGYVKDLVRGATEDMLGIEVNNTEFYLRDMVKQLQYNYKERLELLNTELLVGKYDNTLLRGDIERAQEALENVIENALKYGDGKPVSLHFSREEDCHLLTIRNTGCELPQDEILHIFDSFWRGSNAQAQPGSGLGLYIARQILHKMDGDIYASIEEDAMQVTFVFRVA